MHEMTGHALTVFMGFFAIRWRQRTIHTYPGGRLKRSQHRRKQAHDISSQTLWKSALTEMFLADKF